METPSVPLSETMIPVTERQAQAIEALVAARERAHRELELYVTAIVAGTEYQQVELLGVHRNGGPPQLVVRPHG